MVTRKFLLGCAAALCLFTGGTAVAQDYPNKTVKFVVPYEPGGGNDLGTRLLAQKLGEQLKQTFVVENRAGISGISGATYVSEQKPDGYTLLEAADTQTSAPYLLPNVTLDPEKDLVPITKIGFTPFIWVVHPSVPAKDPKELIALIKKEPESYRWGMGGIGTPGHLAIEKLDRTAGINPLRVPYKGNGPAVTALMSGEVNGMLASPPSVSELVQGGKLRVIGVATAQPLESFPGVPTVASFGFPGFEASSWFGIWGPKGMPQDLVKKIHGQIGAAMADPELQKKFISAGILVSVSKTPEEFAAFVKSEITSNKTLIKELNIHL